MSAVEVVAERFEIREEAGSGGMGTVYRARDRTTGQGVALKLLEGRDPADAARFLREGAVLAELSHPHIVRWLTHGTSSEGRCYLALEWLEGEDLRRRLRRGRLSPAECITLGRKVGDALGYAHRRGLVHRDVKPSNIFVVEGDVARAKLLDFGIVRRLSQTEVTSVGARVGTLAYMSPEQARGLADTDARVDVFALGAVLYQALTGHKPFPADDPMALIGKILLCDPEPIADHCPEAPPALIDLLGRMLAKDPKHRPVDGDAVAAALADLPDAPAAGTPQRLTLTGRERRLVCLVLVQGDAAPNLLEPARALGARIEPLVDGSLVATVSGAGAATDLATRAARLALAAKRAAPGAAVALATGRGIVAPGSLPLAEVIDRAARLVRDGEMTEETRPIDEAPRPRAGPVRLDDTTAGLLGDSFDVGGDVMGLVLHGERSHEPRRTLLGRETPCVARDAELASLESLYRSAVEESRARSVLVTAPAGVGKSRLRHELLRRLGTEPEVFIARGDPISAGAPLGMLAEAIRRAARILAGEPSGVSRRKLVARVGRNLPAAEVQRVAEFVGEIVKIPFPDERSVELRSARADPMLLFDQMRHAFEAWLAAECAVRPVVLVLEDLQWGDPPTISFVDGALRALADRPLFLLALARPEVATLFPRLWSDRGVQEIRLPELSRRASERLVRAVLGEDTPADLVAGIAERAAGNALYLEELIRAAAEGKRDDLPETVLAMVQARLESLEPEGRQVLRAASIFGRVFWRGGLHALLPGDSAAADWLAELDRREVTASRGASRFSGEAEHVFRHEVMREAAYAMLTESDRALGHRLAGEWLERMGETEAQILAEHYERGDDAARAAAWYRRAAAQALAASDFPAVLSRCERGLALADEAVIGEFKLLQAEALAWRGEFPEAEHAGMAAMGRLPPRSQAWYASAAEVALAAGVQGSRDRLFWLFHELHPLAGAGDLEVLAATRLAEQLIIIGDPHAADELLAGLEGEAERLAEAMPGLAGRIYGALAHRRRFGGDAGAARELVAQGAACFERAGDHRNACLFRERIGFSLLVIGDHAAAEKILREAVADADRMGLGNVAATARHNLGLVLAYRGRFDEARQVETAAKEAFRASGNRRLAGAAMEYLAQVELEAGDAVAAEEHARAALAVAEEAPVLPLNEAGSLALVAQALLRQGRAGDALAYASRAARVLDGLGGIDDGEAIIRLTLAEALRLSGREAEARIAIEAARARLLDRAARIRDERDRRSFLENVPENARTLKGWD